MEVDDDLNRLVTRGYQYLHRIYTEDDWEDTLIRFRQESYKDALRDFDEFMSSIRLAHEYVEAAFELLPKELLPE
jgi:phosphatidylserine/phosphatidylglycerophosphate/cardiolipin synthase-like enzyme